MSNISGESVRQGGGILHKRISSDSQHVSEERKAVAG